MKRPGFEVKLRGFFVASAGDSQSIQKALDAIKQADKALTDLGFIGVGHEERFRLSKAIDEVPADAPLEE